MNFLRRFISIAVVAMLSLSTVVFAQDQASPQPVEPTATSFTRGLGNPATSFDNQGDPIVTIVVTDIELDWTGYDSGYEPDEGKMYVAVTVEYTNHTDQPLMIDTYYISVTDSFGSTATTGYVPGADDITDSAISIEAGEAGVTKTVYPLWTDTEPMMVLFQMINAQYTFVYLGED